MTRAALVGFFVVATSIAAAAQDAPAPEQCLTKRDDGSALTITHGGKTYHMANEACRAQFAADPERYSQLYDALLELEAEGAALRTPSAPSLVPS